MVSRMEPVDPARPGSETPATPGGPAPYPAHWEADVLLRDGSTMRIRPILSSDADALQAFHEAQSEESTYFRFFAPMRSLPPRDLERLVTVDHTDRVALVMLSGERIVAVGRYDRIEAGTAEVAFNVSDAHQGRGLGSVLLEHLAAAARERGIDRFVADVLPSNARMIRVFSDAGYDVRQRYEDGVISLEFQIDPTQRSLDVVASREQRTDAASMRALLAPEGVLVVAGEESDGQANLARRIAANLAARGDVTCVGEPLREVAAEHGHPWLPGLPAEPVPAATLAYVAIAPGVVLDLLPTLAAAGVRGVVVLGSGFDRDGAPTQVQLVAAARAAGVRLVGPRSYGLVLRPRDVADNAGSTGTDQAGTDDDVTAAPPADAATANGTLAHPGPAAGPVALFSQSAALSAQLLAATVANGIGVATYVSAGHRADVSGNDLLQYASDLPDVRAVALYLESLGNPRKFARVAGRVSSRVPVVAVVGASQRGEGGLGRAALEEAMLAAGVIVAPTMQAMLDAVALASAAPLPRGRRVAVLGSSIALIGLAAGQLSHVDPDPILVTYDARGGAEAVSAAVERLSAQEWDVAVVIHVDLLGELDPAILSALTGLTSSGRPVLAVVPGLHGLTPELAVPRLEGGTTDAGQEVVPAYPSVEEAVAALELVLRYAQRRRQDPGSLVEPAELDLRAARGIVEDTLAAHPEGATLEPAQTRAFLAALGITMLPSHIVHSTRQAVTLAREIGWPVALKSLDPELRRRSLGGVRLDITRPLELVEAMRTVRLRQGGTGPVELQAMAPLGVACVVRGWDDPIVGPVVSFGLAGDATELLEDATYALPPLRSGDVHRLVRGIRAAPRLLSRLADRLDAEPDLEPLEDVIARVAEAVEAIPQLRALELTPALATEEGILVLSASVRVGPEIRPDGGRRALRPAAP